MVFKLTTWFWMINCWAFPGEDFFLLPALLSCPEFFISGWGSMRFPPRSVLASLLVCTRWSGRVSAAVFVRLPECSVSGISRTHISPSFCPSFAMAPKLSSCAYTFSGVCVCVCMWFVWKVCVSQQMYGRRSTTLWSWLPLPSLYGFRNSNSGPQPWPASLHLWALSPRKLSSEESHRESQQCEPGKRMKYFSCFGYCNDWENTAQDLSFFIL